ncbi:MAG: helix-turn-helix transcriptional regulator [Candidatus Omnitrophica bacterium]|nr:hypothetical protein [bacterium]NUN96654.1 helix-turn-helix transcriptional regulator [Candidatus Omnitrophota bacterium]
MTERIRASRNIRREFDELLEDVRQTDEYWLEGFLFQITEDIHKEMEQQKISRVELSRRLGVSKSYVTKILGADVNLTARTLVRIARALGCELTPPRLKRRGSETSADFVIELPKPSMSSTDLTASKARKRKAS